MILAGGSSNEIFIRSAQNYELLKKIAISSWIYSYISTPDRIFSLICISDTELLSATGPNLELWDLINQLQKDKLN